MLCKEVQGKRREGFLQTRRRHLQVGQLEGWAPGHMRNLKPPQLKELKSILGF